jgi:hypothetical protein
MGDYIAVKATFKMTNAPGRYRYMLLHFRNRSGQSPEIEHYELRSTEEYETMRQLVRDFLAYITDPFAEGDQTLLIDLSDRDPNNLPCFMRMMN